MLILRPIHPPATADATSGKGIATLPPVISPYPCVNQSSHLTSIASPFLKPSHVYRCNSCPHGLGGCNHTGEGMAILPHSTSSVTSPFPISIRFISHMAWMDTTTTREGMVILTTGRTSHVSSLNPTSTMPTLRIIHIPPPSQELLNPLLS